MSTQDRRIGTSRIARGRIARGRSGLGRIGRGRVGLGWIGWLGSLFAALVAACGQSHEARASAPPAEAATGAVAPTEVAVFAAASLREACTELGPVFEKEHGAKVVFNFGASNALAQQIVASGKGDVFISADEAQMDVVEKQKVVAPGTRSPLLSNVLVVVQPKPLPAGVPAITRVEALADPAIARLSLANPEAVPAGKYAKAWLEAKGVWAKVEGRIVPGVDVRAALAAVESGAAQAGIVYATDAAISKKVDVVLRVPREEGPKISYPVAALARSEHAEAARAFVDFLHGTNATKTFERFGFVVVSAKPAENGVR